MSGRRPRKSVRAPQRPGTSAPRRRKPWFAVMGVLLLLVGAGAAVIGWHSQPMAVPAIRLDGLDPGAAAVLNQQLAAVRQDPHSGEAWGRLGKLLADYGFSGEAEPCLAEAEKRDPDNARWAYFHSLLLASTSPARSLAEARKAARIGGNEPEAVRLHLARLLAEQGEWESAAAELRVLVAAKPDFAPARLLLAHAVSRNDNAEAIRLARACTGDSRTARAAWQFLANLLSRSGETGAAMEAARQAAQAPADSAVDDPYLIEAASWRDDPHDLSNRSHALLAAGQLTEASHLIARIVREHPEISEGWLLLGRFNLLRKQPAAAEEALRRHLRMEPRSTQGLFQLGMALMAQQRWEEAAEVFGQATRLKADFGAAYYNQGFSLAHAGHVRESLEPFATAIRCNPEHVDSYLMLAEAHLRLHERSAALRYLEKVEEIAPSHPGLKKLRAAAGAGSTH